MASFWQSDLLILFGIMGKWTMNRGLFRLLSVLIFCAMLGGYVTCADENIQGVIYINSDPVGADIFLTDPSSSVDGLRVEDLVDITPKQFSVEPGDYIIYLQKYGYVSWWQPITVNSEVMLNLGTIPLTPQEAMYGGLHIETNPADATIVLDRVVVPEIDSTEAENTAVESKVYGKTPISFESLPPGSYHYTITKEKYHNVDGSIEVVVGRVSEVAIALTQIATTEPVKFHSLPVGAEVYIIPCKEDCDDVDNLAIPDPDAIKAEANYMGYIGYTPTTFEMPDGKWRYLISKDSYDPVSGIISVAVGTPVPDVNGKLTPVQQTVEVYFESVQDGVTVRYDGMDLCTTTTSPGQLPGCWALLPAEKISEVTFSKEFYEDSQVIVDTSLFKGRPSKWGTVIDLQQSTYTITALHDDYSTITPEGAIPVPAGGCAPGYNIGTVSSDYQIKVPDGIKLDGNPIMDIGPHTDNVVLNECDITVSDPDGMTLSVESEKKTYTITLDIGPGGSVVDFASEGADDAQGSIVEVPVPSGEDSPEFYFSPKEGYVLSKVIMYERDQAIKTGNGPYFFDKVRADFTMKVEFRPISVIITVTGDTTHGDVSQPVTYDILYNEDTREHNIYPHEGYTGKFNVYLTDTGEPVGPPTDQFQKKGVTQDLTVEAVFSPILYDVQAVAYGNGSISPSEPLTAPYMSSLTFVLTPMLDNSLIKVLDNGVDVGTPAQYVLSDIMDHHEIKAFFTGTSEYPTIVPKLLNDGGTIDPSGPQIVPRGSDVSFTITADSCHTIDSIVITDIENGLETKEGAFPSPHTVTLENVQVQHELTVKFVPNVYTISVTQSQGGTIEPDGLVSVSCGESVTFTITPDSEGVIGSLIVDGNKIDGAETYTFSNVAEDHTFSASFTFPPETEFSTDLTRAPPNYPVEFHDLTTNSPDELLWNFGDGEVSRVREPIHYYTSPGIYDVVLTAFNKAGQNEVSGSIEITTDPIAKFTLSSEVGMLGVTPPGLTPPGFTVDMTNLSLNAEVEDRVTFAWDFGDGIGGSIERDPSYTYTTPGVYKVGLKVEKPYITADYYYQTITILQEPIADFIAHPISGPAPLTVEFEDMSQGFPTSWFWAFGDDTGSYDVSPTHVYTEPGVYDVTLSIASDEGSSAKVFSSITVT